MYCTVYNILKRQLKLHKGIHHVWISVFWNGTVKGSVSHDIRPLIFSWFEPILAPDKRAEAQYIRILYDFTEIFEFTYQKLPPRIQNFRTLWSNISAKRTKFENPLACLSGARIYSNHEKWRSNISVHTPFKSFPSKHSIFGKNLNRCV